MKLLILFSIPLLVKSVPPGRAYIIVSLVVTLTVNTFETI